MNFFSGDLQKTRRKIGQIDDFFFYGGQHKILRLAYRVLRKGTNLSPYLKKLCPHPHRGQRSSCGTESKRFFNIIIEEFYNV